MDWDVLVTTGVGSPGSGWIKLSVMWEHVVQVKLVSYG